MTLRDLTREILNTPMYLDEKESTIRGKLTQLLKSPFENGDFAIEYLRKEGEKTKEWVKKWRL